MGWLNAAGLVGLAGALGASGWVWLYVRCLRHGAAAALETQPVETPAGGWPGLAVLVAARDEEASVAATVRSLLAQDYPGLKVVVVDDRSTDRTGAILDDLAHDEPRLRVVHVTGLPPGWLGKTHALQSAAAAASAGTDWLLFTDADVVYGPSTLRKAVGLATRDRLDFLTVAPDIPTETFGERVFLALFVLSLTFKAPPWDIADRDSPAAVAAGAFMLTRTAVFHAVGGFGRIALSVDDDVRLAQALKFAGYRLALATGRDEVTVRWHVGVRGIIRGLEKNFFAAFDFRPGVVAAVLPGMLLLAVFPFLGLFVGPWWTRAACAAGVGSVVLTLAAGRRLSGVAWYHGLFLPVAAAALGVSLVRSVWMTYRRGGVSWRGHLYPLAELRAHVRRRNAWLRELWLSTR